MWYRVFGLNETDIQPAEVLEQLRGVGLDVQGHFRGDDEGWFEAALAVDNLPLTLSRFLASEEGVRNELNTWAAWVELQENNRHRDALMRQLIAVRQVFAVEVADDQAAAAPGKVAEALCTYLATRTGGFFQVDGRGFCSADGTLLISE